MFDFKALISECDSDIKSGRIQSIPKRLKAINTSRVPREWRLPLANVCRRAGLYSIGLTLLNKLIQPTARRPETLATPAEMAEYSVLLMRIGDVNEAMQRLAKVDAHSAPEVHLFRAFGNFYRWEFDLAIDSLREYLNSPVSDYQKLVGKVNLAHALVESERYVEAQELLEENIQVAAAGGYKNLQSLSHVYRSQVNLDAKKFGKVKEDINFAKELLGNSWRKLGMIQKWSLIAEAIENKNMDPINRLRVEAKENNDWGTCREADLFSLKLSFVKTKFLHLVFGTPLEGYRRRIYSEVGSAPDRTIYILGQKSSPRLDIRTGEVDGESMLSPGRKCHQLVELLLRDFYEPRTTGSLFFDLFPGEYFNVATSPHRVHQIILRTRQVLEEQNIPVKIQELNGFYFLEITGDFSFRVPLERKTVTLMDLQFENLKTSMSKNSNFTLRQAQDKLQISKCTVWRLLSWAEEKGKVLRMGSNNSTTYSIVNSPKPSDPLAMAKAAA